MLTARKLFENRIVKSVLAAMNETDSHQNNQKADAGTGGRMSSIGWDWPITDDANSCKSAAVMSSVVTLLDSGAVPDVIVLGLCDGLHVVPIKTKRRITMADSREAVVDGEAECLQVKIDLSTAESSCLLVQSSPYDLIFSHRTMKNMRASLDFDRSIAAIRHGSEVKRISLITEGIESSAAVEDEFASGNSDGVSSEQSKSESESSNERDQVKSLC